MLRRMRTVKTRPWTSRSTFRSKSWMRRECARRCWPRSTALCESPSPPECSGVGTSRTSVSPDLSELVLQSFSIPLTDFTAIAPSLDAGRIREINFVFDRTEAGTIALDEVGFSKPPSAYLEARLTQMAPQPDGSY